MSTIVLRLVKGSPLTNQEIDDNFNNLNVGKAEKAASNTFTAIQVIEVNSTSPALRITQTGTGDVLLVEDSANPDATPFKIDANGNVITSTLAVTGGTMNGVVVGGTTPAAGTFTTLASTGNATLGDALADIVTVNAGTLNFATAASKLTGDFTHATLTNRLALQSNTTNGNTGVLVLPNGTSSVSEVELNNNSVPTNSGYIKFGVDATTSYITSGIEGTGTYVPLLINVGGSERIRIIPTGEVGIGTTPNSTAKLHIADSVVNTTSDEFGVYSIVSAANTSGAVNKVGVYGESATASGWAAGNPIGVFGSAKNTLTTGTVGNLIGVRGTADNTAAGTVTSSIAFYAPGNSNSGGGTLTNNHAFFAANSTTGTNNYSYYSSLTAGTNNYAFYGAGTAKSYFGGDIQSIGAISAVSLNATGTGANILPTGTSAQRPTASVGMIRYNTETSSFEGYTGTWGNIGGGFTSTDDTTTNASYYPAIITTAGGTVAKTSSTKLYFNPSTGTLNATIFNSLSDINSKTNISLITNAIGTIGSLRGVEFNWKDTGNKSSGVIAQEIQYVLPHLVSESESGELSVNYSGIIGYLIEAIHELKHEIDGLKV